MEFVNIGRGEAVRSTQKAVLVGLVSDEDVHWIPFSVIRTDSLVALLGEEGSCHDPQPVDAIYVEDWFADKEGLV